MTRTAVPASLTSRAGGSLSERVVANATRVGMLTSDTDVRFILEK